TVTGSNAPGDLDIDLGNTGNLLGGATLNLVQGGAGSKDIVVRNDSVGAGVTFDDVEFGTGTGSGNLSITANGSIIQTVGTPPILTTGTATFTFTQPGGAQLVLPRDNVFGSIIVNTSGTLTGDLIVVNNSASGTITIPNVAALLGGGTLNNVKLH